MATEYIVGIDFGKYYTTAWVIPIKNNDPQISSYGAALNINDMVLTNVLPSKVNKSTSGHYSLQRNIGYHTIECMKSRISMLNKNPEILEAYSNFIRLVIERLLDRNQSILTLNGKNGKPNFQLCMAYPTHWNERDKNDYFQFFNKAISDFGIQFSSIVSEGEALLNCNQNIRLTDTNLAIDLAAESIRYTVSSNGKIVYNHVDSQLGAGIIEQEILNSYRNNDYEHYVNNYNANLKLLDEIELSDFDLDKYILDSCRLVKEEAYTNYLDNTDLDFHLGVIIGISSSVRRYRFEYDFSMSEVTMNYRNAVAHNLRTQKSEIEKCIGKPIDNIILGSTASKMHWVFSKSQEVFPNATIHSDRNVDLSLACGIANLCRNRYINSFKSGGEIVYWD